LIFLFDAIFPGKIALLVLHCSNNGKIGQTNAAQKALPNGQQKPTLCELKISKCTIFATKNRKLFNRKHACGVYLYVHFWPPFTLGPFSQCKIKSEVLSKMAPNKKQTSFRILK